MNIEHLLDETTSTLTVRPTGPLQASDFELLTKEVDNFIERTGELKGLILELEKFPGYENIAAALSHMKFIREHHRKVKKMAVVTDSNLGDMAEKVAALFVSAEMKHFPSDSLDAAKSWITGD